MKFVDESLNIFNGFDMKNHQVNTCIDILFPIFFSIGDHQMAVNEDVWTDSVPNALDESRPECDGPIDHPIPIHHIQVNPFDSCRNRFVHGLSKFAEICRENTRCDDHWWAPV